jgi:hypothetical protein
MTGKKRVLILEHILGKSGWSRRRHPFTEEGSDDSLGLKPRASQARA